MAYRWHVTLKDGKNAGPLEQNAVLDLIREGKAVSTSHCWREGLPDWIPLGEVPEFAEELARHPSVETVAAEGWDSLKQSLDRGRRGAMRKMKEAQLRLRLGKLHKECEVHYTALGKEVYENREMFSLNDSMRARMVQIGESLAQVAETEQQIKDLE